MNSIDEFPFSLESDLDLLGLLCPLLIVSKVSGSLPSEILIFKSSVCRELSKDGGWGPLHTQYASCLIANQASEIGARFVPN